MRHNIVGKRLGRNSSQRNALMRNLLTSIVMDEKIITTDTKAKELKREIDKIVTMGKTGDLSARRRAASVLLTSESVKKLFSEIGPRFAGRSGGYTRVTKLGFRFGDASPIAQIEFVELGESVIKKREKKEKKREKVAASS